MLLDGPALARSLGVPAPTLRTWARRKRIKVHGHDHRGRALYDVDEVIGAVNARRSRHGVPHSETPDSSTTSLSGHL